MIRVAQILGKMNGGGVEQVVMNYYRFIDRRRVQFDFVVEEGSLQVPLEEIHSLGGRVFWVPAMNHLFAYQRALRNLIREQQWRIVHSHLNALSVFPLKVAAEEGVPVRIAHSHSAAGGVEPGRDLIKEVLRRFSNRYPTLRFACSQYAGRWLFGSEVSFEVVHNAIDVKRFTYNPEVRREVRTSLGISDSCLVVGHVGRFAVQKNHRFLIDVFEQLHSRCDSALILIGSGSLEHEVRELIRQRDLEDSVFVLGYRQDVERFYQAFDVFVLPSYYEGLGNVIVEAQAAGLPCIASNRVTRESDVSDRVIYLNLRNPSHWAETIIGCRRCNRGINQAKMLDQRGYGVRTAAAKLQRRYCDLLSEESFLGACDE